MRSRQWDAVPCAAAMVLDRRLLPTESPDRVFDELKEALKLDPPIEVELLRGAFMYGHVIDTGAEILQIYCGCLARCRPPGAVHRVFQRCARCRLSSPMVLLLHAD